MAVQKLYSRVILQCEAEFFCCDHRRTRRIRLEEQYHISLFDGLSVRHGDRHFTNFRTRNAALLLARLALEPQFHERAALIEWLWPDCDLTTGCNRLSVTLSSLRRDLGATQKGEALFLANHDAIRLNSRCVSTDVARWEAAMARAPAAPDDPNVWRAAIADFGD